MEKYQQDYSSIKPKMYDPSSRIKRGQRIIKLLKVYFKKNNLSGMTLLDVGSSTGIIDNEISKSFDKVIGIDIDKKAVNFANNKYMNNGLEFRIGDAMNLDFPDNTFDVVVCAQVYEHVSNPKKMLDEIYRVLKPSGICYFAAINKYWPKEAHYNLLFLSYLPKKIANIYVKLFHKADKYWETPLSWRQLKRITKKFKVVDYTEEILSNPQKFGYKNPKMPVAISKTLKYFAPTFFWILVKKG